MRVLIVDDEPLARRGLRLRLGQIATEGGPAVDVLGEAANGREAIDLIEADAPDLMFLDIQMPGLDGFQLLRALPIEKWPLVIFTTAYDQYALDAFRVHAVDYLLKPIDNGQLRMALLRAQALLPLERRDETRGGLLNMIGQDRAVPMVDRSDDRVTLKDGNTLVRVAIADIRWIDAAGDYVVVHARDGNHIVRASLRELEERLPPERFARIHRSAIVNVAAVVRLRPHQNGEYFVDLDGGKQLKLSRGYRDQVERFA